MKLKRNTAFLLAVLLLALAVAPALSALEPHGTGIKMRNWLTNDPNYTFSEAYKTSVWYENFSSLELTDNDRNNILRIAVSQLGYHEGDSPKDFDGMNTSSSGNYIEYARLLVPHYNNNSYDWCACFVNWCLNQARFDKASSEIGCWRWVGELKDMGMWQDSAAYQGTYTPKPADMIFFNWNGHNKGSGHIGYVLYVTDTHVYTIEGNADNNVTVRSYGLYDSRVIGYGTPPYNEGDEPTIDYSYADGMPRGTYVVHSYSALMTSEAGGGETVCAIPAGSTVTLQEIAGSYAKVCYGEQLGYLPVGILWLLNPDRAANTLTYDANGGENTPASETVSPDGTHRVTASAPTLEGDVFLGWAMSPYDTAPAYQAGDPISLSRDTVLYAVWENRSDMLAEKAFAEGKAPAYERPDTIAHSGALLLGSLPDLSTLDHGAGTRIKTVSDTARGRVLSLSAVSDNAVISVTLNYGELMDTLRLSPITGDRTAYAVVSVKCVSGAKISLFLNGSEKAATATAKGSGWQYLVFDLTEAGFDGPLKTLRLDAEGTADQSGNTLYLADVCFAASEEQAEALALGKYIYPAQELNPPETETETDTETDTEPVTAPPADESSAPESDTAKEPSTGEDPTDTVDSDGSDTLPPDDIDISGCFSAVGMSALPILAGLCAGVTVLKKRKD